MSGLAVIPAGIVLSCTALAQPAGSRHRIGVLTPSVAQWEAEAFGAAMRALGYVEGESLVVDLRSADGVLIRLPELAADLAHSAPRLIVAVNTPCVRAAIDTGTTLPIVMAFVGDPIASGFVTNLARPGGNVTGVTNSSRELVAKRFALLMEAVPRATRVAVLTNPDDPITAPNLRDLETAAAALGIEIRPFAIHGMADLEPAFAAAVAWRAQALFRVTGPGADVGAATAALALRHRLPAMLSPRRDVDAGGLMSYFPNLRFLAQRVAAQVDRILKGTPPGEIPVEQPTRFELVINLRTARVLGLELPASLLAQADEVIE